MRRKTDVTFAANLLSRFVSNLKQNKKKSKTVVIPFFNTDVKPK
jgi:hypothetical protein